MLVLHAWLHALGPAGAAALRGRGVRASGHLARGVDLMAVVDLRDEAAALAIVLHDAPPLSAEDLTAAHATWRGRMVNEYVSSRVFGSLVGQLIAAEVRPARVAEAAGMVGDELRHARACAGVLHALGGEAIAALPDLPTVPEHEDAGPLETVLRNVLSICCLSETVAVALISAEYFELEGTAIGAILRDILADEVRHSRFGWQLVSELMPRVDAAMKRRLRRYLKVALRHLRDHELSHISPEAAPSVEAGLVGVCDGGTARALFFETVLEVILPALEARGLPAGEQWRQVVAQAA